MAEQTSASTEIAASASDVMAALTDFDAYPEWAGVKSATVLARDERGRPTEVAMHVSQMGVEANYTLAYSYAAGDGGLSWTTKEASGAVKDVAGEYRLAAKGKVTEVAYSLTLELAISLPGFLRKQAEKQVISLALDGLRKRVESSR